MAGRSLQSQLALARDQLFPRDGDGCAGKKRYVSRWAADKVIEVRRKDGVTGLLFSYACNKCDGWHLTKHR